MCAQLLEELEGPPSRAQCVREAQDAATLLASEGMEVAVWSRFPVANFRAQQPVNPEVGEWTHGWQFHASIARDTLFATSVHLPPLSTDHRALRALQRGPCASRHFNCLPTCPEHFFELKKFTHVPPPPPLGRTSLQVRGTVGRVSPREGEGGRVFCLAKPRGTLVRRCAWSEGCREAGARVKGAISCFALFSPLSHRHHFRRIVVFAQRPAFFRGHFGRTGSKKRPWDKISKHTGDKKRVWDKKNRHSGQKKNDKGA